MEISWEVFSHLLGLEEVLRHRLLQSKEDISDEMNAAWKSTEVELIQNRALRWELDRLICSEEKKKPEGRKTSSSE